MWRDRRPAPSRISLRSMRADPPPQGTGEAEALLLCMGLFSIFFVEAHNRELVARLETAGDQIALPAILTINAISAVLNTNEMMPCTVALRRMILSVMPTSETCAVMPITNEK